VNQGEKFLLILLYQCEGYWSYAMDMKQALTNRDSSKGTQGAKEEESKIGLKN